MLTLSLVNTLVAKSGMRFCAGAAAAATVRVDRTARDCAGLRAATARPLLMPPSL
jgi:hypothetical protein